ncbi:flagellar hook assembly protein FlgD [Stutzerimonas urumqiensis]|uniref:flagellar hook assembly protein FlgD n=1 Tax=Stutzerimonas urumqiensis TaxID=638269 RepID=UPI000EB46977|nr:flagellar hook assembly protein FlgD [Stutzerimonas urumqiensis]
MSTTIDSSAVLDQYAIKNNTSATSGKSELGKDEFLKLLVAQLNNQDPLSPQENGEFIAQMAQFSTVEGIGNLNTSMEEILSSSQSTQALQASSLVGRKVIATTDKSVVDTTQTMKGSVNLTSSTSNLAVNVYNASGEKVGRVELGQQSAGQVSFMWDGKDASGNVLPPGTYKFEAQASVDGTNIAMSTNLPANVDSVTLGQNGGEMTLNLAGIGAMPLSSVKVIGQ